MKEERRGVWGEAYESRHGHPIRVDFSTAGALDFEGVVEGVFFRVVGDEVGDAVLMRVVSRAVWVSKVEGGDGEEMYVPFEIGGDG